MIEEIGKIYLHLLRENVPHRNVVARRLLNFLFDIANSCGVNCFRMAWFDAK